MDFQQELSKYVSDKLQAQRFKWRNIIALPLVSVPFGGNVVLPVAVNLPSDGYFELIGITGSFDVPPGQKPGVAIRLSDSTGNGNDLTEGFVDLDLFLSPGPSGEPLRMVYKFNYLFQPNSTIRAEFINRSPDTDVDVKLALHGRKVRV